MLRRGMGAMSGTELPAGIDIGAFLRKRLRLRFRFKVSSLRSRDEEYQGKLRDMLVEHAVRKIWRGEVKVYGFRGRGLWRSMSWWR